MSRLDVLNLEYTSFSSRDTESATLVCNYLRMQGLKVVEGCVFQGYELLLRHRPKLLYITSVDGADIHVKVAQFAKYLGCKVVSHCGEGIYSHRKTDCQFLGSLYGQSYPLDKWLLWNETALRKFKEILPEIEETLQLTGSPGHDRYRIVPCHTNLTIPQGYRTVVGVGCWAWWPHNYAEPHQKEFIENEGLRFEQELRRLIAHSRDTFFLLKEHPGAVSHEDSGISSCIDYPNVMVLKQESIFDCIAACDIWLTVESTTATEAWLLGKQTALLNPSGTDWPVPRQKFYAAQPNFPTADAWLNAIARFQETGELPGFADYSEKRQKLLCEIAGHTDGLNHVRTGNIILDVLASPHTQTIATSLKDHVKLTLNNFLHWHFAKYHRWMPKQIPYFKQFEIFQKEIEKDWHGDAERKALSRLRHEQQKTFYAKNNLSLSQLRDIYF